ncbi:MAG: type III-B CRISPR-associated protein Cas10/Cmr2 [bacterium]
MTVHLSFSVGPVQAFVAQARRTRDLWAGSWLLSYLAECALVAAEEAGGESVIPHRAKPKVITSKQTAIGGIPNRFEVQFVRDDARDQAQFAAQAAEQAFRCAWQQVADAVWKEYVAPVAGEGNDTASIWKRQVENFWELSWVIGEPDGDSHTIGPLAAMRKNFRNVPVPHEPGTKCSLMATLQEISGHFGKGSGRTRDSFWQALRQQRGIKGLNLTESERLCAVALIKRLFPLPHIINQAIGNDISEELRKASWPSTAFMSARPWLTGLSDNALAVARKFAEAALDARFEKTEHDAASRAGLNWAEVDGPVWFRSTLQTAIRGGEDGRDLNHDRLPELLKQQRELHELANGPPVPYYALLLMDGDSVGELVRQLGNPRSLSDCLGRFAGQVDEVVSRGGGRTVYAGGDDVLALLPAKDAFATAETLCDQYRKAFPDEVKRDSATISAAIVYAHWRYPLRQVLRTAHELLDDVAKDRTGRDSVALGIVLGSGLNTVWSVPWSVIRGQEQGTTPLLTLLENFGSDVRDEKAEFNASYLYFLRERFGRLFHETRDEPGQYRKLDSDADASLLRDLAHAEYRRRMSKDEKANTPKADTEAAVDRLMSISRRWQRTKSGVAQSPPFAIESDPRTFSFDGWQVARFLRQIQDGKVDDHD